MTAVTEQLTEQPATTYAEEATTLVTLLPLPTEVIEPSKVNETQNSVQFNGTYHALGVNPPPQAFAPQSAAPLNFEEIVTSEQFVGPEALPEGAFGIITNVTLDESAAAPDLHVVDLTNETETITKRWGTIKKRQSRPNKIDWRSRWGFNWITTVQVRMSYPNCIHCMCTETPRESRGLWELLGLC